MNLILNYLENIFEILTLISFKNNLFTEVIETSICSLLSRIKDHKESMHRRYIFFRNEKKE